MSFLRHVLLVAICIVSAASGASGQVGGFGLGGIDPVAMRPPASYYAALEVYRQGDLIEAARGFELSLGQTRKDSFGRWIDAIPVYAMMAECQWHMGNIPQAREHCDAVLQLTVLHRGWLRRVAWDTAVTASIQSTPSSNLWPQARAVNLLPTNRRMQFRAGTAIVAARQLSGVLDEDPNVKVMDLIEIMRGVQIASYRRRMILGPLSVQDPLSIEALEATKYPAGLQIPIGRALIGSMRAAERFANGDDGEVVENANKYSVVNNGVHPLSTLAQLCQASALAASKKPTAAIPITANIVHVAARMRQYEWTGEALQLAAGCATKQNASEVSALAQTAATGMLRRSRLGTLHCLLAGADASVTAGELNAASTMLNQAQSLAARGDVAQPRLSAYGAYVAARLAAARGDSVGMVAPTEVDKAIGLMREFAFNRKLRRNRNQKVVSMPRIYQLELIRLAVGKQLGGESSDSLLAAYAGQPPAELWRRDPVDALSSIMSDRSVQHLARLQIAVAGRNAPEILARTDDLIANRFHSRLALGGRLTEIRALVRMDDDLLPKDLAKLRNDAPASIKNLRAQVKAPIPANKSELAGRAERLESLATQIALDRFQLPRTMLPPLEKKAAATRLPDGTAMLTFVSAGNRLIATFTLNGKVQFWTINGSNRISGEISRVLRGFGVGASRGKRLPEDAAWKTEAIKLRKRLVPDEQLITADKIDQLVIVPDRALWYLPFEILPLGDETSPLLGDKIKVRYAATPGLAFRPPAALSKNHVVGIGDDKFFAPRKPEINQAIVQSLADSVNDSLRLPKDLDVSTNLLADSVGHLLIAAPTIPGSDNPFATVVAPHDRGNPAGTLAAWMRFPAKVPASVLLPGLRTGAGTGQLGTGDEIFMTVCALQASGVRSVMLSRWIVGGESSSIVLNEFLQELPFSGMHASWQRARAMLRRSELSPTEEPMLTQAEHDIENLSGNEPFFWASYMVVAPFGKSELKAPGKASP